MQCAIDLFCSSFVASKKFDLKEALACLEMFRDGIKTFPRIDHRPEAVCLPNYLLHQVADQER